MFSDWAKFAGFSAVLAIALAIGILALQEPNKPAQEYQRLQTSEPKPDATTNRLPWLMILKTLHPGGLVEIAEYCNSYPEHERKNWPQSYVCDVKATDVWLVIFTDYDEAHKQSDPMKWCEEKHYPEAWQYRFCLNGSPHR
jgi:hypothetical protein